RHNDLAAQALGQRNLITDCAAILTICESTGFGSADGLAIAVEMVRSEQTRQRMLFQLLLSLRDEHVRLRRARERGKQEKLIDEPLSGNRFPDGLGLVLDFQRDA